MWRADLTEKLLRDRSVDRGGARPGVRACVGRGANAVPCRCEALAVRRCSRGPCGRGGGRGRGWRGARSWAASGPRCAGRGVRARSSAPAASARRPRRRCRPPTAGRARVVGARLARPGRGCGDRCGGRATPARGAQARARAVAGPSLSGSRGVRRGERARAAADRRCLARRATDACPRREQAVLCSHGLAGSGGLRRIGWACAGAERGDVRAQWAPQRGACLAGPRSQGATSRRTGGGRGKARSRRRSSSPRHSPSGTNRGDRGRPGAAAPRR